MLFIIMKLFRGIILFNVSKLNTIRIDKNVGNYDENIYLVKNHLY
jgi:hypothetical protein